MATDSKKPIVYPEVGARFIKDQYVEYRGFKGRREVIQVVAEMESSWENEILVYRYGALFIPDYETYTPERYSTFSASENLRQKYATVVVPEELLSDMYARALEMLFKRVNLEALLVSVAFKRISADTVEVYFKKDHLPYHLTFTRFPDGSIARTKTENKSIARGHLAKGGNTGIPKTLCKVAFHKAVDYFDGKKYATGSPQEELFALPTRDDDEGA